MRVYFGDKARGQSGLVVNLVAITNDHRPLGPSESHVEEPPLIINIVAVSTTPMFILGEDNMHPLKLKALGPVSRHHPHPFSASSLAVTLDGNVVSLNQIHMPHEPP